MSWGVKVLVSVNLIGHMNLQTRLANIEDIEIQQVIEDICWMLRWDSRRFGSHSIFLFLQDAFTQSPEALSLDFVPQPSPLKLRLEKLQQHSFYEICGLLKPGESLEMYDRSSLFGFLKKHFASHRPKKNRKCKPTLHDRRTALIVSRRRNGDL